MSLIEIPTELPVSSLSVSSVGTYLKCPERWRRRYLCGETEPVGAPLIIGSAVGAACNANDSLKVGSGEDLPLADVLDAYSDEFDLKVEESRDREGIDWAGSNPGVAKDEGAGVLSVYHQTVAPTFQPVSVEREFVLSPPGVDWVFKGYMDVETAAGGIIDRKVKGKALSAAEAKVDVQPTSYLLARREEARAGFGEPATGFDFHVMKKLKTPVVDIVPAPRTDAQLDAFYQRLLRIAAEIAWRAEHDNWGGAVPGSWWCSSRYCGFFDTCSMGGAGAAAVAA
jgi:hypothetical protein